MDPENQPQAGKTGPFSEEEIITPTQVPDAAVSINPPRRSGLGVFVWLALIACIGIIAVQFFIILVQGVATSSNETAGAQEQYHSLAEGGSDKVAVISVNGVIMEGDGFVKRQIDRVRKDDDVKAVVLRVNSPGGTVTGSDYLYHHLTKLRDENEIPIVVSMGSMATSGGYYVAMAVGDQEDSIFAEPTSTTGSIGVIIPHYDVSGFLEDHNVRDDSIASHPRKQMLSMTRHLSDEHREIVQNYVNEAFVRFKEIVKSGRPGFREDEEKLSLLATGEIFSATKAHEHGLVDKIGFIEDAIDRAIEIAGLDKDDVRVVKYMKPTSLFELATMQQSKPAGLDLSTLLEMSTPRAYYLTTMIPPFITSNPK